MNTQLCPTCKCYNCECKFSLSREEAKELYKFLEHEYINYDSFPLVIKILVKLDKFINKEH